uniref:NRF domain-containing protein n=1 Tax=Syphacia muris TaxID=451379 RepID=A0A0N5ALU5_9BILA
MCRIFSDNVVGIRVQYVLELDSFGRPTPNLFSYSNQWIGSWEECLSISTEEKPSYRTQFCYVSVVLSSSLDFSGKKTADICNTKYSVKWSVCMPKVCNNTDITAILNILNKRLSNNLLKFCSVECKPTEKPGTTVGYWIILIFGCIAVALVIIATFFDYCISANDKNTRKLLGEIDATISIKYLLSFSLYSNASDLLNTDIKPGHIHSVHALKVLSLTWVIYGHTYSLFVLSDNLIDVFDAPKHRLAQGAFTGAFNAVDTFFFISGLLLGYIFFHHIKQNREHINQPRFWLLIYLHRYFRLGIAYFIFLAFEINFYDRLSFGPLSLPFLNVMDAKKCRQYWWRNVLFINAMYVNRDECMGHTWYLASEMQLFLYAPLILVPLAYSITAGVTAAGLITAMFLVFNYFVYYKYNFPINHFGFNKSIFDENKVEQYELILYKPFWSHAIPYIIGVFTGYFLDNIRGRKLHLSRLIVISMWLAICSCAYGILFGLHSYYMDTEHGMSIFERASYNFWCKIGWSVIIAWVIIACEQNFAGPVKTLLEWNFWIPFSRMCYAMYIVHVSVISMVAVKHDRQFHFTNLGFMVCN